MYGLDGIAVDEGIKDALFVGTETTGAVWFMVSTGLCGVSLRDRLSTASKAVKEAIGTR